MIKCCCDACGKEFHIFDLDKANLHEMLVERARYGATITICDECATAFWEWADKRRRYGR